MPFPRPREDNWNEVEPRVFRPARSGFRPILECAFALLRDDATRVALAAEQRLRTVEALSLEALSRRTKLIEDVRARAMAPEDAWLRLAPKAWLADERRWFVGEKVARDAKREEPTISVKWTSFLLTREAPSHDYLTTLVVDPANVEAAEALAREACRRMAALGCTDTRLVWLAEENVRLFDYVGAVPFRAQADRMLGLTFPERPESNGRAEAADVMRRNEMLAFAERDVVRAHAWSKTAGAAANPFEPIVGIWRLGYALVAMLDTGPVLAATAPKLEDLLRPLVSAVL